MGWRFSLLLTLFMVQGAPSARGDELILGLDQTLTGQSNVDLSVREVADGTYQVRPVLELSRPEGKFTYDIRYSPAAEIYFQSDELNGVDHFAHSTLEYKVLPVANLRLRADLADFRATGVSNADGSGGIPDVGIAGRINRFFSDLQYEHQISRITLATGTLSLERYEYSGRNGVDSLGFAADFEVLHQPVSNFSIGGSLATSLRDFDGLPGIDGGPPLARKSRNAVVNPNLVLRWKPTPTVTATARVGPAVLVTRTQGLDGSTIAEEFVTGFLDAELRRDDHWGYMRLALQRGEETSAGSSGSTTIRDSATAEVFVRAGSKWSARFLANWNQRKSERPVGVLDPMFPLKTKITQYWGDMLITRRLSDRLRIVFMLRYLYQAREDGISLSGASGTFDNVIGRVMLQYRLAPIDY